MSTPYDRAARNMNVAEFAQVCEPADLGELPLFPPTGRQYILRMLIARPGGQFKIPRECMWTVALAHMALKHLPNNVVWDRAFAYLTIRNGVVTSITDDQWHVDGFSTRVPHLPEQNFVWTDCYPTEYVTGAVEFPATFDPLKHDIHRFLGRRIGANPVQSFKRKHLYIVDPYVVHRRPQVPVHVNRCFVRLTFTHVEIDDVNNTQNPALPVAYTRDGIKDFRQHLKDFDAEVR